MRLLGEALSFGVVGVGHWSVFAAAHSDVFGDRPNLSSRVQTADLMWARLAAVSGGIAGVSLTNKIGALHAGHISHLLGVATFLILSRLPETLPKAKRKPRPAPPAKSHRQASTSPLLSCWSRASKATAQSDSRKKPPSPSCGISSIFGQTIDC